MAQCDDEEQKAIDFLFRHESKDDAWWQQFRAPEGSEPPSSAAWGGGPAGGTGVVSGDGAAEVSAAAGPPAQLSARVHDLIARSDAFNSAPQYSRHPLATQRVATLVADPPAGIGRQEFADQTDEHIAGVRPIANIRVESLLADFLRIKQATGSAIEQATYGGMNVQGLLDRLLRCRPLAFCERNDSYLLRSGQRGRGGFESIGTSADMGSAPLTLGELQSYDEMCLSALVGMSVPTHFINEGGRRNNGVVAPPATFEKRGILIGLVGARFERPGLMEWQHMYITQEQNTVENGYGPRARGPQQHAAALLDMWAKFYGLPYLPTYDEVVSAGASDMYCQIGHANFLNVQVYKERMRTVLHPFLADAQVRAAEQGKEAYCHVVGLGLGVWMVTEQQGIYLVEVVGELLANLVLPNVGTVDFSWFPSACAERGCNAAQHDQLAACAGGHKVRIRFSKRDPAAKLSASDCIDQFKEPLLVAMYAWDSNSFPGNEYWFAPLQGRGCLSASGDPAAAACSTIAELQNPDILPDRVCAAAMKWYGQGDAPEAVPPGASAIGAAAAAVDLPGVCQDPEAWQHTAIDAAREGDWKQLERLILPKGDQPLMPDELLNGIPGQRSFNILHQMAMLHDDRGHGAGVSLERLIKAGCRFDTSVRSQPFASNITVVGHQGQLEEMPGANLTAAEIATRSGSHEFLHALEKIPQYEPASALAKSVSVGGVFGGGSAGHGPGGGPYDVWPGT